MATRGARVAVHYRSSAAEAEAVVAEIRSLGTKAQAVQGDLRMAADVERVAREAATAHGELDVVVASAAVFRRTPWESITEEDWDFHIDSNLKSSFLLARATAPLMRNGGVIIFIADWSGMRPYVNYVPYCVSKAGVIALTHALAQTLAPRIRVNCVCPGTVLPPESADASAIERIRANTPMARIGKPEDVVGAVRFLVEGTDFATGSVLVVDGGRLVANPGIG